MLELEKPAFDATAFLASAGLGRRIITLRGKQTFFSQDESAASVFYLQSGRAKLTVCKNSREATITLLAAGDFLGEESLASAGALHTATATAITACTALEIDREEMIRAMHEEPAFAEKFFTFVLARGVRIESDLVDQLFNSSERRLAKTLLLMAEFGERDESERVIPAITEERLAEMIGAPRSAVSFFMKRFCKLGFIDYHGGIRVHNALLNVILHDQLPSDTTAKPAIVDTWKH
jgi:CRP-like cAMP-binding protein